MIKILYVEDIAEVRRMMVELMEGPGRTITSCGDADTALAACAKASFDLVVTDVSLPGRSGTELARRLLAANPQQWIALCSGYSLGNDAARLGSNVRALAKPFEIEEFDRLIEDLLVSRSST